MTEARIAYDRLATRWGGVAHGAKDENGFEDAETGALAE